MVLPDAERVRSLLAEAVTILCKNTITYQAEFQVEGLIGITIDQKDVFLVNIKESVQDKEARASNPQQVIRQPPPLRPISSLISSRPKNVSRPIPARSPFIPNRLGFGSRARYRGRGRGLRTSRPQNNIPKAVPGAVSENCEPPVKKQLLDDENCVDVDLTEGDSHSDTENTDDRIPSPLRAVTDKEADASRGNDPLSSLDFSDMMKQYEETGDSSEQKLAQGGSDIENTTSSDIERTTDVEPVIIKPEKETDHESQSMHSTDLFPDSQGQLEASSVSADDPSVPSIVSQIAQSFSGQFMDPNMPGCSSWNQSMPPVPVSIHPHHSPMTSRPLPSPQRSGPGRPRPSHGASAQISPGASQGLKSLCRFCGQLYSNRYSLARHVRHVHQRPPLHPCSHCRATFSYASCLRRHEKSMHNIH